MSDTFTLSELSEASSTPARTIRFYIARGLLPGPVKVGRSAAYSMDHLERLHRIRALQNEGRMLAEIAQDIQPGESAVPALSPVAWWQYAIQADVLVSVRADVAPWRKKQILAALQELASRLSTMPEREAVAAEPPPRSEPA